MRQLESEVVGGIFWIVIGLFFALCGAKLNFGTLSNPGSGFLPVIVALVLVFSGLITLTKGLTRSLRPVSGISWKQQALITVSVFFYGFLLEFFGFLISTFVFMFIVFGLLVRGKSKWYKVFLYAAGTALASWLIFSVALKVPFPSPGLTGIWG